MRPNLFSPTARRVQKLVAVAALAVLTAGCVTFNGATTTTQEGDVSGTLRYSMSLCANGASGFPSGDAVAGGGSCAPAFMNPFSGSSTGRIAAAILVPVGATAPAVVTATLSVPATVTRDNVPGTHSDLRAFRTLNAAADFNAETPPPAGSTWVPYISEVISVPQGTTISAAVTIDVTTPLDSNGNPPATAARQVSLTAIDMPASGGVDPTAGQTDTLTYDCYVDADADGTPEVSSCAEALDPATPQTIAMRRLTLTGAASATVQQAGAAVTSNQTLRLDGAALPSPTVAITSTYSGTGVTASASNATAVVGTDVTVPVTLTAASGATSGTLTVTATTSNGTTRSATVPVTVTAAAVVPPTVVPPKVDPPKLRADDGTRPETTITARRLANGKLRVAGTATDKNRSAGLTGVSVQAFHGIGNERCLAWNGTKVVNEPCTRSLARWIKLPLTIGAATTTFEWTTTTPVAVPGLWVLRARSADGDGLVSRVATARVTVPNPARR